MALRTNQHSLHTLYIAHSLSTLHSTHYPLHSQHTILYTLHTHYPLHSLHSTLDTRHSTLYTRHSTLDTRHSTLDTRHSTLYTLHSTLYTHKQSVIERRLVAIVQKYSVAYQLQDLVCKKCRFVKADHMSLLCPKCSGKFVCKTPASDFRRRFVHSSSSLSLCRQIKLFALSVCHCFDF